LIPADLPPEGFSDSVTRPVNGAKQIGIDLLQHYLPGMQNFRNDMAALIHAASHAVNVGNSHYNAPYARGKSPESKA